MSSMYFNYVSTKFSLACDYVIHLWRSYLWITKIVVKSITKCNCLPIPLLLNVVDATQALTKTLVSPTTLIIYHWISPPIFNNSHAQLVFFASHKYVIASSTLNFFNSQYYLHIFWMLPPNLTLTIWKKKINSYGL